LDDAAFERQVAFWSPALVAGGSGMASVAHLHHLTPITKAVARLVRIASDQRQGRGLA
jgi:hypothetical protein